MPCRILVPRPGIKPTPPALEAQSQPLNYQGSPQFLFFRCPQPTLWSSGIKWTFDGISSSWHILKKDKERNGLKAYPARTRNDGPPMAGLPQQRLHALLQHKHYSSPQWYWAKSLPSLSSKSRHFYSHLVRKARLCGAGFLMFSLPNKWVCLAEPRWQDVPELKQRLGK